VGVSSDMGTTVSSSSLESMGGLGLGWFGSLLISMLYGGTSDRGRPRLE
jgi:hypothetical protein